ncbi:MAG: hypothetical protein CMG25_03435 [Candidatus Marinimicrobia bacterium]|nr:hypothetical protein [Candidatus Neomarinimicrobiota bacterium]|tara:strand:- start:15355 stop:16548 length:1194 start_codon:yes stop_codon:yes gene_type:complete
MNNLDFLLSLETQGIKLGLQRTTALLLKCNNPEKDLKSIQIIGTNGKGTTAASISSILQEAGYKIGLYTSPHLVSFNERIKINNKCIPNNYVQKFIERYKQDIINNSSTFFETMTALALDYFKYNNVDMAILETGLGGEYDSVTACNPYLQVFTSISKDHMHILGKNIEDIATTKAKAIKDGIPCISFPQKREVQLILDNIAQQRHTSIDYNLGTFSNNYISPLVGNHQKTNILLAIKASKIVHPSINEKEIMKGIKNISWPGRMQVIQKKPLTIFDVAHNEDGLLGLCSTIKDFSHKGKKILILSLQNSKHIDKALPYLSQLFDDIICTQLNDRMYSNNDLINLFSNYKSIKSVNSSLEVNKIINEAHLDDLIAIVGSHYWGTEIEKIFKISLVSM